MLYTLFRRERGGRRRGPVAADADDDDRDDLDSNI